MQVVVELIVWINCIKHRTCGRLLRYKVVLTNDVITKSSISPWHIVQSHHIYHELWSRQHRYLSRLICDMFAVLTPYYIPLADMISSLYGVDVVNGFLLELRVTWSRKQEALILTALPYVSLHPLCFLLFYYLFVEVVLSLVISIQEVKSIYVWVRDSFHP